MMYHFFSAHESCLSAYWPSLAEDEVHARVDDHVNKVEKETEKKDSHDHHQRRPGQLPDAGPGDVVQLLPGILDELDRASEGIS